MSWMGLGAGAASAVVARRAAVMKVSVSIMVMRVVWSVLDEKRKQRMEKQKSQKIRKQEEVSFLYLTPRVEIVVQSVYPAFEPPSNHPHTYCWFFPHSSPVLGTF